MLFRSAVAIEQGSLARQHLPTLHHHVHVFRIQFQSMTDPPALSRGRQRRPAAEKRVVDQFPPLGVVLDGALHQRNWFLRGVIELVFPRPTHDEFRGGRIPDGRVLAGLAEPGRILLAHVPAGLVLIPVVGSGEHNPALVPNDLLGIEEADPQQTIQHLPCEDRGVPNVGGLQTSHELERCRPVGTSVRGNGGIGVALGALLHVAGLRGPASVQPGTVAPFRIEFDPIGRIAHQQDGLRRSEQPLHRLLAGGVPAQHPVRATGPQVACLGHCDLRYQIVWLPGESITGRATVVNASNAPVQASLQWSIAGPSGVVAQPAVALTLTAGEQRNVPLNIASLPNGDYTLNFRLMIGNQEVDRLDSPVRVLNPILTRQPDQKVRIVNGAFSAGGRHIFLRGVNYWPRFIAGTDAGSFNGRSWLEAGQYDPDLVEADLTEIAALHFNLLNIQFNDFEGFWAQEGRALIDFLERCRNHGIWVQVSLRTTSTNAAYAGQMSSTLESYLQAAYLPGNDRVFAYDLLWEPMVGTHDKGGQGRFVDGALVYNTGRLVLDPDWRAWVNDQYGSLANAQQIWGFTAPLDGNGQLTNPLDDQMENDGPWRIMVAAYRRFLDDYLGRNLGAIARQIRRSDPDTPLTYRNWTTMTPLHNDNTGYDIGSGAAHLDFFSPERYAPVLPWPDDRAYGLVTAYSRYRTGGKPVLWAEFGADIGKNSGSPASRAAQAAICDTMMRQIADDGSNGASVWWWPGGYAPLDGSDFGIIDPDGTPRASAKTLAQWNANFEAAPPDLTPDPPATLTVDRDTDARGSYRLFTHNYDSYVQTRQAGHSVILADQGTGTDTSTMPLIQAGNAPYAGTGPLKFANGELAGIHIVCPSLDVTVENGATLALPPGAICQVTPTLVNTGEAQWLPGSAPSRGVILHTNAGDLQLTASLPPLQRTALGPLTVTMGQSVLADRK